MAVLWEKQSQHQHQEQRTGVSAPQAPSRHSGSQFKKVTASQDDSKKWLPGEKITASQDNRGSCVSVLAAFLPLLAPRTREKWGTRIFVMTEEVKIFRRELSFRRVEILRLRLPALRNSHGLSG